MKYDNFLQASKHQVFEWVKTGKMSKTDFIKWLAELQIKEYRKGLLKDE